MPFAAPKHCAHGHPPYRGASCPACAAKRKAEADARRPSAPKRGYDREWKRESKAFLALPGNRFCACGCGQLADMVHHNIAHKGDMRLFWDRSNWAPYNSRCNSRECASREGGFGNELRPGVVENFRQGSGYRAGRLARNSAENCTS